MYTYRIKFYGRLLNAIGVRYEITEMVIADTSKDAIIKLYEKYDSVHNPEILECFANS